MIKSRWIGGLAALTLLVAAPKAGATQEKPVNIDFRGGIGLPVGDLGDAADPGPAFNVGVNFGVAERVSVRLEGGAELYPGAVDLEEEFQEGINPLSIDLIHLHGGLRYHAVRQADGWFVDLGAGAGVTNLHIPRVDAGVGNTTVILEVSELYLSANGGGTVGYQISEDVSVFLDGQAYLTFGEEEDTEDLVTILNAAGADVSAFSTSVSLPVTAGVRLHF